jgi:putative ABC transport system permease protein
VIRHLLKLVWKRKRANALIVAEIFVSFLVVFAVMTGAVTVLGNWRLPLGFDWQHVWDVSMEYDVEAGDRAADELHRAVMQMIDEARAFPEVEAAAVSNTPPYSFSTSEHVRDINGRPVRYIVDDVTDGFADVMKMKVVRGRWFDRSDDAAQYQPVVLDANAATAMFGSGDPIGQKLEDSPTTTFEVVGVVAPYRKDGEPSTPVNAMFVRLAPDARYGRLGSHLMIRVRPGTPAAFEQQLAERLQQVVRNTSFQVRRMDQMRTSSLRLRLAPIVAGAVIGAFLIAMVGLGLTGVLWQNVSRRTRELGLRRAMGATGGNVRRQILIEVALLTTVATLIGSVVILQLPVLGLMSLVTPAAFTTGFAGALATIYALTVLCGLYPSWLASRRQPADALRYE